MLFEKLNNILYRTYASKKSVKENLKKKHILNQMKIKMTSYQNYVPNSSS